MSSRQRNKEFILSRRNFLKYNSYGISLFALTQACKSKPVKSILPFLSHSEIKNPGKKQWFATTCNACNASCPALIKTFENRPVKIEGNPLSKRTGGGLCSFGQASILGLYSIERGKFPKIDQKNVSWNEVDEKIIAALNDLKNSNKPVVLISNSTNSLADQYCFEKFSQKYPNSFHLVVDQKSGFYYQNGLDQPEPYPRYIFSKATVIAGFNCDFLGTWLTPIDFTNQYAQARKFDLRKKRCIHYQFESVPTLTGMNADNRFTIKPEEEFELLESLLNKIKKPITKKKPPENDHEKHISEIAQKLLNAKGRSLVISGSENPEIQLLVTAINSFLGNFGRTIDLQNRSNFFNPSALNPSGLLSKLKEIKPEAAIFYNVNNNQLVGHSSLMAEIQAVPFTVSLNCFEEEVSNSCSCYIPTNHFLESWDISQPLTNCFSVSQPVISPIYKTRQIHETILKWCNSNESAQEVFKTLANSILAGETEKNVEEFHTKLLSNGLFEKEFNPPLNTQPPSEFTNPKTADNQKLPKNRFFVYKTVNSRNGSPFSNHWLQELPDPVTGLSYGPFATISAEYAQKFNFSNGENIEFSESGNKLSVLPLLIIEHHSDCFGIPAGFKETNGLVEAIRNSQEIQIRSTGYKNAIPAILINSDENIKSFTEKEYPAVLNQNIGKISRENVLHKWAMVIDLNACTGCGACVISCQIENNIPNVGEKEVLAGRKMNWLRIDKTSRASTHIFTPIPCQQCQNAPCEPVCPVSASSHSTEGLNMQNYQRCIGARFCAANCPYEVRKFNFLDYKSDKSVNPQFNDPIERLVLNPEVTVREYGVAEKCTFCYQRISEVKSKAKTEGRKISDSEIQTACSQSCPAKAIVFGDLADPGSLVSHLVEEKRAFRLMESKGTEPSVFYLAKLINE